MKHKIEVEHYELYEHATGAAIIFLEDKTKVKYNCFDILKIKDSKSERFHSRLITNVRMSDTGLKEGYVLAVLAAKMNVDGCIASAVCNSLANG